MSKQIQFSVLYQPIEDRILMRVHFADGAEMQLFCTRRIVKGLLEITEQLAEARIAGDVAPQNKAAVAAFSREHAVNQGDFQSGYKSGVEHPDFGPAPRLLHGIQLTALPGEQVKINLQVRPNHQLGFSLPIDGLWGLVHLFREQTVRAAWGLVAAENLVVKNSIEPVN